MISINQNIWKKLAIPSGDKLIARLAFPETTNRLLYALDARGKRHILISLNSEDTEYQDITSRGISVITRDLIVQGKSSLKYIDIECTDLTGYPVLDLVGADIADRFKDKTTQPTEIVKNVLIKWRKFWGQSPQQTLSKEEQMGLFGELWFLSKWLIPKFGPSVVLYWRGPWGSRYDFEWPDKSVEVKSTSNSRGRIFRINGLDQLENPSSGKLYLFGVRLREETSSKNNLPELIEYCRKSIGDSEEALNHFENAISQMKYSSAHQNEYAKFNLSILENVLFAVDRDFPRLTKSSFKTSISAGIERIEYEINLNTHNHLVVTSNPDQLILT